MINKDTHSKPFK